MFDRGDVDGALLDRLSVAALVGAMAASGASSALAAASPPTPAPSRPAAPPSRHPAQIPTKPAPEAIAVGTVEVEHPYGVAFAPDGSLLVAAGAEGILEIDPVKFERSRVLVDSQARSDPSIALAVAANGDIVSIRERDTAIDRLSRDGTSKPLPPPLMRPVVDGKPLRRPAGIAITPDGSTIAIADTGNDRIVLMAGVTGADAGAGNAEAAPPRAIGTGNCGDRPLRAPTSVAFDPAGRLFVADSDNHRIVRFGRDGRYEISFGTRGANQGQFERPLAVTSDAGTPGTLLIADHYNHRVQRLDEDGDFRTLWGMHAVVPREGDGKIHYPVSIASDPARGLFAVAEPFERRVQIFRRSREGERVPLTPPPPAREGVSSHFGEGIAVDGTLLAVWEPEASAIVVFDLRGERPTHVTTFGSPGTKVNEIGRLIGIACDEASERVWILDAGNRRLVEWSLRRDPTQELRFEPFMARVTRAVDFDALGRSLPALDGGTSDFDPIAIAFAPGELLALDARRKRVVRIDDATLAPRGLLLDADMGFPSNPMAMSIDPGRTRAALLDGRDPQRLVAVVPLAAKGDTRVVPRPQGLDDPQSIAWLAEDRLVVTDGNDAMHILTLDGRVLASNGARGVEDGKVWHPRGVAGAADGSFFLVDWGNHRLQRFDRDGEWLARFGIGRSALRPRLPDAVPPMLRPRPGSSAPAPLPPATQSGPWPRELHASGRAAMRWRPVDEHNAPLESIPLRDPFFVRVEQAGPEFDRDISVDAAMPHHGHGMNLRPIAREEKEGVWIAGPLLFHMPGAWEIYFDLALGGRTQRLQDEVLMDEAK